MQQIFFTAEGRQRTVDHMHLTHYQSRRANPLTYAPGICGGPRHYALLTEVWICSPPAGVGVQRPSEVAHPCGKDAAGACWGRWAAEARRRPLDDELGGDWQQIPAQTERGIRNRGWMPDSKAGLEAQRSPKEIRHFSSLSASNPSPADAL